MIIAALLRPKMFEQNGVVPTVIISRFGEVRFSANRWSVADLNDQKSKGFFDPYSPMEEWILPDEFAEKFGIRPSKMFEFYKNVFDILDSDQFWHSLDNAETTIFPNCVYAEFFKDGVYSSK